MAMKRVSSSGAATTSHFMLAVYNVVICCANFRQVKVSETSSWTRRVTAVSVVWKHGRGAAQFVFGNCLWSVLYTT